MISSLVGIDCEAGYTNRGQVEHTMKRQRILDEPITAYEKAQRARVEHYAKKREMSDNKYCNIYEDKKLPDECYLDHYFKK